MKIKKLINLFLLPIFILTLSSSFIKADLSIKDFNLDDVLNSGRELMDLNYGLHHLEDYSCSISRSDEDKERTETAAC